MIFDESSRRSWVWDVRDRCHHPRPQVIAVDDPKPAAAPTSFFDRAESGLDDEDVDADLESILDECIGANLPTRNLNWHYRSRHESLIAFSNHAYYDGELVTLLTCHQRPRGQPAAGLRHLPKRRCSNQPGRS